MRYIAAVFIGLLILAGLIALTIGLDLGGLIYQKETASLRGRSEAERIIEGPASRIQLYNEFFNLCAGIQAKEKQIDILANDKALPEGRRAEAITATRIARTSLITDYNGRASRNYTAGRFKAANLPYRISPNPYEPGGQKTLCEQ